MKGLILKQKDVKKSSNVNFKSTIRSMIKKVPGDLIKKKVILRQRHLNSLLSGLKFFERAEVTVMEGYLRFKGLFSKPPFMFMFSQKMIVDEEIYPPNMTIHMKNDTHKNLLRINLNEISGFDKYLSYQNNYEILKELTLDTININSGCITLSSIEKIDITIKEDFIKKLIQDELIGKYGLEMLNIYLEDGYFRVTGKVVISNQQINFDKNVKIIHVDIYNNKYIEMELDDQDILNDKITAMIRIDKINKVKSNKLFKFLIEKFVFHKSIKVKFDKDNEQIILSYK